MDIKTEIELAKLELQEKQNRFHNAATDEERSIVVYELRITEDKVKNLLSKSKGMK